MDIAPVLRSYGAMNSEFWLRKKVSICFVSSDSSFLAIKKLEILSLLSCVRYKWSGCRLPTAMLASWSSMTNLRISVKMASSLIK